MTDGGLSWRQVETLATRFHAVAFAGFAFVIYVGGVDRFPLPSFGPLRELVGGAVWVYATAFAAAAFLTSLERRAARLAGLVVGTAVFALFAACFGYAVVTTSTAASTGPWVYLMLTLQNSTLAALVWVHGRKKPTARG